MFIPVQSKWYLFKSRRRIFASAEIRQSPNCVPGHRQSGRFRQEPKEQNEEKNKTKSWDNIMTEICHRQKLAQALSWRSLQQQRREDITVQHIVPAYCAVPGNVTQSPDSLKHKQGQISLRIIGPRTSRCIAWAEKLLPVLGHPRSLSWVVRWRWAQLRPRWPSWSAGTFLMRCWSGPRQLRTAAAQNQRTLTGPEELNPWRDVGQQLRPHIYRFYEPTCSVQLVLFCRNSTNFSTTPAVFMTSSIGGLGSERNKC